MESGIDSEGVFEGSGGLTFFIYGSGSDARRYSSEDVYRALNSYQVYLDQWMGVDQLVGGKILVREIVDAYRKRRSAEWIISRCVVVKGVSNGSSSLIGEAVLPPYCRDDIGGQCSDDVPKTSFDDGEFWRARWVKAGLVLWSCYVFFGIFFYLFVLENPDLSFSGFLSSALVSLLKSLLLALFLIFLLFKMLFWILNLFDGDDGVERFLVCVGLIVGGWLGVVSYKEGYDHLMDNQLAPLEVLFERCLENGVVYGERVGAVCMDGRRSRATGAGACSHHGGVAYWRRNERQTMSDVKCRMKASEISWRWRYSQ